MGEIPERIETAAVSPAVFQILGMKPALGRSFASDEDQPDKNHVAILSAGLWQRRFGRDPNILGKTLSLDGGSFTIVGVAPAAVSASRKPVRALDSVHARAEGFPAKQPGRASSCMSSRA